MNETHAGNIQLPRKVQTLIGIILIILGTLVINTLLTKKYAVGPDPQLYQAVFLTNNQVYFGKLEIGKKQYILKDVYYLQSDIPLQSQGRKEKFVNQTTLIKLGDDLHGPEDSMYISKDHLLFWENLKADSQLLQSIKTHKAQRKLAS